MKYILSIVLDTDRRLLKHEVAELVSSLELQLEEPQNMDNGARGYVGLSAY